MKRMILLAAAISVLGACSTPRDETWIGKNVGVAVDSRAETKAPAAEGR